jgi:dUTP pyrophosphatase
MISPSNQAILYLCVDPSDTDLLQKYQNAIEQHNHNVLTSKYPNSGFDLFFPKDTKFGNLVTEFVSMNVKCEMHIFDAITQSGRPTGYYMYPRSSISKTPLLLANSVGIIDSGYRGPIIGAFRNISSHSSVSYMIEKHNRLLQICAPDLRPILVELVGDNFFENSDRGAGGFGSTGR